MRTRVNNLQKLTKYEKGVNSIIAIRNYNDTKSEYEIAKLRSEYLEEKKQKIYSKYFSNTSNISEIKVSSINKKKDPILNYLEELSKIDPLTNKSLEEELEEQKNTVDKLKYYVNLMEYQLKHLKGIEYQIYCAIIIKEKSITAAINYVSVITGKDTSTLWKYHYPKIKKYIKQLKK